MEGTGTWFSFLSPFMAGMLVATGVGLIIGLEREFNTRSDRGHLAGLRTFPLLGLLGFVVAWLGQMHIPHLFPVVSASVVFLAAVAYYAQTQEDKFGLTTEVSLVLCFFLGGLAAYGYMLEALAVAVVVTALLSLKGEFHEIVEQLTEVEISAFIKFAVLALLVMPMLPNQQFGPENLLNYRDIGWVVLIVSSLGFVGYLLFKFRGAKQGILLTALVGGLVSSTMIAWVFAARSREHPELSRTYAAGIVLSSTVMYGRICFLAWVFNHGLGIKLLLPCLLLLLLSLCIVWYLMRKAESGGVGQMPLGNPLDVRNALLFGLLFVAVSFFLYYSRQWMGNIGLYVTSIVSGVADMDAITVSTAKWASSPDRYGIAVDLVILAMLSNTVFKMTTSVLRGHKSIRPALLLGFGAVLVLGAACIAIF